MAVRGGPAANGGAADKPPVVTPAIAAEAATWVARLHGPSRSREMELQCLKWQARSAAHRHAFERCTDTWMEVPNAARAGGFVPRERVAPGEMGGGVKRSSSRGLWGLAGAGLVVVAAAVGWQEWADRGAYSTAVGETHTVLLDDGTRMSMNTDTRLRVAFDAARRTVEVQGGEAVFEVAKDAKRPFVVRAAGSEVVALGTVFSVRLAPPGAGLGEALTVTLIEGRVSVQPSADGAAAGGDGVAPAQAVLMAAGQRVRLVKGAGSKPGTTQQLDLPKLDQVMAWRRNEAVFDQATLSEAVAEMNRYSRKPVVLVGELSGAEYRVSGQFRTGDNAAFASALAALHGLVVQEHQGRLELFRRP